MKVKIKTPKTKSVKKRFLMIAIAFWPRFSGRSLPVCSRGMRLDILKTENIVNPKPATNAITVQRICKQPKRKSDHTKTGAEPRQIVVANTYTKKEKKKVELKYQGTFGGVDME